MKAISQAIDKFCLKHRKFGIPRLIRYIVFASAAVLIISLMDTTGTFIPLLRFNPALILRGEIWRLVTWVFLPIGGNLIFAAIALYFYFFIGGTLEREWGAAKFTLFYIFGVLLNIIYGFIAWSASPFPIGINPNFLNLSMFFAFAALFPEHKILLFFVIPVKVKWLALISAGIFAFSIIAGLVTARSISGIFSALLPIISVLNFLLFCGYDLVLHLRPIKARTSKQTIDFKRAARKVRHEQSAKPYRHKCAVCGKTDVDNPDLEFRYCSRCNGYHCFCIDHINNHVHF